ncbi:unnamed protein product [Lota lota]
MKVRKRKRTEEAAKPLFSRSSPLTFTSSWDAICTELFNKLQAQIPPVDWYVCSNAMHFITAEREVISRHL